MDGVVNGEAQKSLDNTGTTMAISSQEQQWKGKGNMPNVFVGRI